MTRTYLDTGVLIAGARGNDPTSGVALEVLDDPDRQFASSAFVRLEALPKAQYNGRQAEVAFYRAYFDAVLYWPSNMVAVIGEAQQLAEHLYYPGSLALDHKKANAASIQTWTRPADMRIAPPRRRWTPADDRELLRLGDPAAAALTLDRTQQSCSMRLWRLRTGQVAMPAD